ncbi:MAG TPA: GntR family transcriptional regulator [Streptosporangiaceae bacterium]|nr:GntR family transcriptional regulator [Streptosporangiaceae bacterium]
MHVNVAVCHGRVDARKIDLRSAVPAYRQLASILREQIESGELAADQIVPSETTLVQRYGVARGTVRRAIEVLRDEDLVVTVQGRGTYVK